MKRLFAAEERESKLSRLGDPLESLGRHVDFAALAASVDRALPRPHRYFGGRPPYPTGLMIRLLLIQQLFNLSDAQLEFQVLDRTSFQRFLGIRDSGKVPDRNTVWAFRERLVQAGLDASLFDEVNRQLQAGGYLARCGQIIDATLVPVPTQRNGRTENAQIKQGKTPEGWSARKRAHKDVDARWTGKHGKQTFGYKLSVSTDCRYKLIRTVHVSPANEGDQTHLLKCSTGTIPAVTCTPTAATPRWSSSKRAAGGSTSSAVPSRSRRSPQRKPVLTGVSPGSGHVVSIHLRVCVLWAASSCAVSACHG